MKFDAFISYSHAADGLLAPALEAGLQRLARRWPGQKSLKVFRDDSDLTVSPALWPSIATAMEESEWYILMASQQGADSKWVNKEIAHWLATRDKERILPVVTDGDWVWDEESNQVDLDRSSSFPHGLVSVFDSEPRYLDLRWARSRTDLDLENPEFVAAIADLAAPIHGKTKDALIGEDLRAKRRFRRLLVSGVAVILALGIAAGIFGIQAIVANERAADAEVRERRASGAAEEAEARQAAAETAAQEAEQLRVDAEAAAEEAAQRQSEAEDAAKAAEDAKAQAEDLQRKAEAAAADALDIAESRRLAGQAQALMESDLVLATLLAVEAFEVRPTVDAMSAILTALQSAPDLRGTLQAIQTPTSIATSADGTRLAAGGANHLMYWDDGSGSPIVFEDVFFPDAGGSEGIAFGSDGGTVAVGRATDGLVLLWDLEAGDHIMTLAGGGSGVSVAGAIDPEVDAGAPTYGSLEAVGLVASANVDISGSSSEVYVWSLTRGCLRAGSGCPLDVYSTGVESESNVVELSPDGQLLATRFGSDSVRLRNLTSDLIIADLPTGVVGGTETVAFSPDSLKLAVGSDDELQVWDVGSRTLHVPPFDLGGPAITSVTFSPDGSWVITGDEDSNVRVWDIESGQEIGEAKEAAFGRVTGVAFGASNEIWVSSLDPEIRSFNLSQVPAIGKSFDLAAEAGDVVVTSSGDRLVTTANLDSPPRYGYQVLDANDGASVGGEASSHRDRVVAIDVSPDESLVVTGAWDTAIRLWDLATHSQVGSSMMGHGAGDFGSLTDVAFHPDGEILASTGADGTVKIWRVADQALLDEWEIGDRVMALDFSPDGRFLAVGRVGDVVIWEVESGEQVGDSLEAALSITSVEFSPGGDQLAAATSTAGTIYLWDVESGAELKRFEVGRAEPTWDISFAPDGLLLAGASSSGRVFLWDALTAQRVGSALTGLAGSARSVTFSPHGETLYAVGGLTGVTFDMRPDSWVASACARSSRSLTEDEWNIFLPARPYIDRCSAFR